MIESKLNALARPLFTRIGAAVKLSDASNPGIPDFHLDLLDGIHSCWIESKILKGKKLVKAKFRPGQLPFARNTPALTLCMSYSHELGKFFFHELKQYGRQLEDGLSPEDLVCCAAIVSSRLELAIERLPISVALLSGSKSTD